MKTILRRSGAVPVITFPVDACDEDRAAAKQFIDALLQNECVGLTLPPTWNFSWVSAPRVTITPGQVIQGRYGDTRT